jgi:Ni/Fe-hydrogenase subunit HybB-like protein
MLKLFIILLVILIVLDKLTHLYEPARGATVFMLAGDYAWIFWVLQIGLVVILPLIILFNPKINKTLKWIIVAAVSVVVGVFFERYYLVIPGAAYPMQFYPGKIEGVYGAVGQFPITPTEMGLSVGILAFLVLLFLLGLKYLEALPPKPPEEKVKAPAEDTTPAASTTSTTQGENV